MDICCSRQLASVELTRFATQERRAPGKTMRGVRSQPAKAPSTRARTVANWGSEQDTVAARARARPAAATSSDSPAPERRAAPRAWAVAAFRAALICGANRLQRASAATTKARS